MQYVHKLTLCKETNMRNKICVNMLNTSFQQQVKKFNIFRTHFINRMRCVCLITWAGKADEVVNSFAY
ncbi:hypothetical protein DFR42_1011099 [Undibacterium pigrum]|uniref:Uncharacterized protein n=1 Tax=Undibacterium pigrum TaxID=401470 RepID=A0A318JG87_9BURK|nr:hypothetical protein DFR42_1011099 [Undibacterium pigrum]